MSNIRCDFPMLNNNDNVICFDNSSTSLKPQCVIDSILEFYRKYTSNAYRGDYIFSEMTSMKIDECRELVSTLLNSSENEIIFTSNCTDAVNLLSYMLGVNKEDKIVCSILEHHSNLLPWVEKSNVSVIKTVENGLIDVEQLENELKTEKIKLVAITAVSNVTGNVQPIKKICELVHKYNSLVLLDCCQYLPHKRIDVMDVDCDFLVFSAHKMCGPSGLGVLYGKKELLKRCQKAKFGGGMVDKVRNLDDIQYKEIPYCFESGTLPIEAIIGFGSAIRYLLSIGYENIEESNKMLDRYFFEKLKQCSKLKSLFPVANEHIPIYSLELTNENLNIHYIAKILSDSYNICVSAGYQCSQPLYNSIDKKGGIRVSLQFYNNKEDIDYFFDKINSLNI